MNVTITSKGQVTIPKAIRNKLQLKTGDKLEFILHQNSVEIIPVGGSVRRLKGMVPKPDKAISLDDMDQAVRNRSVNDWD